MSVPGPLDILAARRRLAPYLEATPLRHSPWLSSATGADVHLKLESVALTNSFKIRGALNALLRLVERAGGRAAAPLVVTASAGNHGRAIALAAERLGLRAVVFTPRTAPETKKAAIRRHDVELNDDAPDYDAAETAAREFARSSHAFYLSPYNHPDVIAGAGTIAFEILEVLHAFDVMVVPIGGGGLASGVGLALKAAMPTAKVIGVEAAASTAFATALRHGSITKIDPQPTVADGLAGNLEPGAMTFDIVRRVVDGVVSVSEDDLAGAIASLATEEHLIVEGAGAAATAGVLARGLVRAGQRAVVIVSGGNIDTDRLAPLLRHRIRRTSENTQSG